MGNIQKITIVIIAGLLALNVIQCFQNNRIKKESDALWASLHTIQFDSLKRTIAANGNVESYEKLKLEYMDDDDIESLLPWSLIMANKYNYKNAYFDVYTAIQGIDMHYGTSDSENSLKLVDSFSKKIAIEYLEKASQLDDSEAKKILSDVHDR